VEDDAAIATALGDGLEDEGYLVVQARDGRAAVDRALSIRPDLILLDVNLPLLDGFTVAAQLRQSSIARHIPIIFLSARRDLSARVRLLQFENVDFMAKPFSGDELLTRIDLALIGARAQQKLQHQATVDALTGLANLGTFRARLAEEHERFLRYGSALSLAMIDVDKLKSINDRYGHAAGSDALRAIAEVLRRQARTTDLAARYGGDEFVVLLPHTPAADAAVYAERVRDKVAKLDVLGVQLTVSIGIASVNRPDSVETDDQLLGRADAAAYAAKRQGGNRICCERP
jgi:diguanylate cyclase (GGDEF)-like protein